MTIYTHPTLSERVINNFVPTRLYIKELVGIKYFGKTTQNNIESYSGSGVVWSKRIKKYGKQNIKTLWISDWYHDPYEIMKDALRFSIENNIVESSEWANLWPENGINGGRTRTVSANKGKCVVADQNGNTFMLDKDSPLISSGQVKSINKGTIGVIVVGTEKSKRVSIEEFHNNRHQYMTLTEGKSKKVDKLRGKITAKDSTGKTVKIDITDERLKSGELHALSKGRVNVVDENGKSISVSVEDPDYISGKFKFSGGTKKGFKQQIVTCPHCGRSGGKSNLTRHHFDKCDFKN